MYENLVPPEYLSLVTRAQRQFHLSDQTITGTLHDLNPGALSKAQVFNLLASGRGSGPTHLSGLKEGTRLGSGGGMAPPQILDELREK